MSNFIYWNDQAIPFQAGETVANALHNHGIFNFGTSATGQIRTVFCGIGQCQSCLVRHEQYGEAEACLLICEAGMRLVFSQKNSEQVEQYEV